MKGKVSAPYSYEDLECRVTEIRRQALNFVPFGMQEPRPVNMRLQHDGNGCSIWFAVDPNTTPTTDKFYVQFDSSDMFGDLTERVPFDSLAAAYTFFTMNKEAP